jgi:hypothetical protein
MPSDQRRYQVPDALCGRQPLLGISVGSGERVELVIDVEALLVGLDKANLHGTSHELVGIGRKLLRRDVKNREDDESRVPGGVAAEAPTE